LHWQELKNALTQHAVRHELLSIAGSLQLTTAAAVAVVHQEAVRQADDALSNQKGSSTREASSCDELNLLMLPEEQVGFAAADGMPSHVGLSGSSNMDLLDSRMAA
jgi:hypothetical protein